MWYIYKTTNLINNKIYIGQHVGNTLDESYLGSGTLLNRALDKYGKENFKSELICLCNTQEETNEKEKYYINFYHSKNPETGYNIADGGYNGFFTGCKHSEETKSTMSKSHTGLKFSPQHKQHIKEGKLGTKISEQGCSNISKSLKELYSKEVRWENGSPFKGRTHSDETKRKMSESHKGKKFTQEHINKLKGYSGFKGRKHSEASKLKMSQTKKQKKNTSNSGELL